jgi:hypothetical protein
MADFAGNASMIVQIIALVLLFVGVIPSKLKEGKKKPDYPRILIDT